MPKKQILGSVIVLVILCFVCMFIYDNYKVVNVTKLIIDEKEECIGNLDLYYTDKNGNNYYLYCLDRITIDYGDRILDLDKALTINEIDMDFIYDEVKKNGETVTYKDGGSLKYSNNDFSLLSCQTVDGNNDYYFGPSDMEYKEGFCRSTPYTCQFIRTYLVLDMSDSNDSDYVYLTLKEYDQEEVVTVKVLKELSLDIIEDSSYEFTFISTGKSSKLDIQNLFKSNKLLSISFTDKTGNDQINENICK